MTANLKTVAMGPLAPRKGRAMQKGLCFGALGIAALMLLVFLLDLVMGSLRLFSPFHGTFRGAV